MILDNGSLSSRDRFKLMSEVKKLREQFKAETKGSARFRILADVRKIRAQLGSSAPKPEPVEEVNPDLDDLLSGSWNDREPKPFIQAVGDLVRAGIASLDVVKAPVVGYLTARGAL